MSRTLVYRSLMVALAAALVAAGAVTAAVAGSSPSPRPDGLVRTSAQLARAARAHVKAHGAATKPNIVFVLTDDLSMDLLQYMPSVLAMERNGMTFNNYFVSDSLCCPSRSSIFTGEYPHNDHVFNNAGVNGGFGSFYAHGDGNHTFATTLQKEGYATAMMGKWLNGYLQTTGSAPVPDSYVAPGWSEWDVAGYGYDEYNYPMNIDGSVQEFAHNPADYLTDVIAGKGINFINSSVAAGKPFMLELATFAPHYPYVPAPQDTNDFPGLTAPRPPNFDVLPTNPPRWLASHRPLTQSEISDIDTAFRLRAQAVQSVDRMIDEVEATLQQDGVAGNTYVVFSSDNGLHTGEYRLTPGKMTAFDTDIHVPLVVTGPGVPAGSSSNDITENVDLAETFAQIGGGTVPLSDGRSLLSIMHGANPANWRNAALVEHSGRKLGSGDPDFQQPSSGNPTGYEALRTPDFLYVEYDDGETEFYNLTNDPFELHNIADQLTPYDREQLHVEIENAHHCKGAAACWSATHVDEDVAPVTGASPLPYGASDTRRTH